MAKALGFAEVAGLCGAFAGDGAEGCLERGLDALRELGIEAQLTDEGSADEGLGAAPRVPASRGSSRWGTVTCEGRSVRLEGAADEAPETIAVVRGLVAMALRGALSERKLAHTQERLNLLSAASFEGIMIHVDGNVLDANLRLAEMLRCGHDEVFGDWSLRNCVAAEDLPRVHHNMASGYEGAYLITGIRKDGTSFRAELQAKQGRLGERPVRVVAVRDVTSREQALEMLRESEGRLRNLAHAAFDLTVLSRGGHIVALDGCAQDILGASAEELLGASLLDFISPSSLPFTREVLETGRTGPYQTTLLSRSGELVPVEIIAVNSTLDGQPTRVAGVRDLRAARRLEIERRELEQHLERAQRLNSLGVLAGGIAHDFNNLLAGILGNADLLREDEAEPERRESLQAIVTAAQRAAGLTQQMLAYAGSGTTAPPRAVDLVELVGQLRQLLAPSLPPGVSVDVDIAPATLVFADPTQLSQVVMNLLTNASEALTRDGGQIRIRSARVNEPDTAWEHALGASVGPGRWVELTVSDTGKGMDAATQCRIFEPFFTTKERGHGLGLAACLGIVSSLGGALRVESSPGEGTRFVVLLPEGKPSNALASGAPAPPSNSQAPCHVLIVDDESLVRQQLRRSLEVRGFRVTEAKDGRAALKRLESAGIDLMLLDMTMPGLSGVEVVEAVRAQGSSIPIVLSSGYVDPSLETRLRSSSFQAFLRKPYVVAELLDAIERARATARA